MPAPGRRAVVGLGGAGGGDLALHLRLLPRGHPGHGGTAWVDRPTSLGRCLVERSRGRRPPQGGCAFMPGTGPGRLFPLGSGTQACHSPAWRSSVGDRSPRGRPSKGNTNTLRGENGPPLPPPDHLATGKEGPPGPEVTGWQGPFAGDGDSQEEVQGTRKRASQMSVGNARNGWGRAPRLAKGRLRG